MYRLSICRPALVLALLLLVVAPWEAAAGPRFGGAQRRAAFSDSATPDLFSGFLSFFSNFWSKAGCKLDPHGQCIPEDKAGCILDPHGQCAPEEKEGCGLDPSGRCIPIQVENGCAIDPHGGCVNG
ncbi:MAG TPA: hypothetical protein VLT87_30530 [Thermoanaerobaculia bacterium]|nr:hypothetical protein [Thermoanaerobaculia bacterium]